MTSPSRNRSPRQVGFAFRTCGGKRRHAGRKPTRPGRVSHARRASLASRFPVHVTLKLEDWLPSLRDSELLPVVEGALRDGKEYGAFRLVHYSIQDHHLHLIAEASKAETLSRGIQGLCIRIARRINRTLRRRGRVFADRYFARILRTPRQTRACLRYVLNNRRRHAAQAGERLASGWIDDRSSGRFFDGWRDGPPLQLPDEEAPVAAAGTWLLSKGWRRCGLLRTDEIPGPEP